MTLTPTDRFTLIMFALGIMAAAVGWYVKRQIARGDADRRENTDALKALTSVVSTLALDVARLQSAASSRHSWWRGT